MENKQDLPGPVMLDVEPVSCSLTMVRSRDPEQQLPDSLSMRLRLAKGIEVRTPDKRSLKDAEWAITLYENGSGNKLTELHNAVGLINYYEERQYDQVDIDDSPEACYAWANIDSKTFLLLRDMALGGKLPSGLRLHARGMGYGWEPDGSAKEWDVKAHKNAVIEKIEVIAALVKLPEVESDTGDETDSFWVEPKPESAELGAMRGIAKAVDHVNARLGWALGVLGLIALLLSVWR